MEKKIRNVKYINFLVKRKPKLSKKTQNIIDTPPPPAKFGFAHAYASDLGKFILYS